MKHTYNIQGMTCQSCKTKVMDALESVNGVTSVTVNLEENTATIVMGKHIETAVLQDALASKYTISENVVNRPNTGFEDVVERSKLQQLKPLFIILFYIASARY